MATQLPLPFLHDYSQGMAPRPLHWPQIPADEMNVGTLSSQLPEIDVSNPQVNLAGFSFGNFGNNQATNDQLRGYSNYYDGAQEYNPNWNPNNPNYGKSFAGIGHFDPRNLNRLPSNLSQDLGAATYRAPQLNTLDSNTQEYGGIPPENVEGYNFERTGILENFKNKLKGWTTPAMAFMKKMGGVTPEKKAFYDAIVGDRPLGTNQWTKGMYGGNEYEVANTRGGLKVGSDIIGKGPGYEKNLYSAFGSKSIEEMENKKLDWALARYNKLGRKGLGTRIYNELVKSGRIGDQRIGDQRPGKTIDTTVTGTTLPGTGGQTTRPDMTIRDFNPREAQRAAPGGYSGQGGSGSGPQGGAGYGPWKAEGGRMAEGGRIGYQEGELVEDEYMAEATPQGMMEENVETVQGEPSREQLEVIALEIFRLPLEELNEEQLNVVYQAAMQQEPSEEEIQFAAQEGPGEGIASLV